ncbi:MAG: hypothetical protein WBA89_03945 [Microcoleus sp.]|uniref:hypothetical protein n=1 Tax=Microcoleus sp. TaxID=44472 RepID=UPI003C764658
MERASSPLLTMVQDMSLTQQKSTIVNKPLTGGLSCPPHNENSSFVEQASCLFLTMVQDVSLTELRAV